MGRPVNPNVPEAGYVSKRLFENTGSICASDFAVVDDATTLKKVVVDPSSQSNGSTYTLKTPATSGNVTLTLPSTSGTLVTTATETNSFSIIQPPTGTSPTASSPTDTLNLTSSDGTVTITGNSSTKTIDLKAASAPASGNLTEATSSILTITGGTGAVLGSGTTIQVKPASGSQNGYLSSTDWTTFNNKQAALTYTVPTLDTSQLYNNFGTCTSQGMVYSIMNGILRAHFKGITGSALGSGTFSITLPASKTVNTSLFTSGQYVIGTFHRYTSGGAIPSTTDGPWPIFYDSANAIITIALSYGTSNNLFINNQAPSSFIGTSQAFWGFFEVPIN